MPAMRAQTADGWTAETRLDSWTVRELCSPFYGCSLSRTLPELAIRCLYGDLVSRVTIVMPCGSALVPVQPGGTNLKWRRDSVWAWRWPFSSESINEHRGVVTAISADVASVLAVVVRAYPLAEHPHSDLNL